MFRVLAIALVIVGCNPGGSHETSRTSTDTTVTPVKTTDTTVVEKKVDVNVDTTKKTHNKRN
jgi:hypothetical protein